MMMSSSAIPEIESLIAILSDPAKYKANLEEMHNALKQCTELERSARTALEAASTAQARVQEMTDQLNRERADFEAEKSAFNEMAARDGVATAALMAEAQALRDEFEGKLARMKALAG